MIKAREILNKLGLEPSADDCIAVQHVCIVTEKNTSVIYLFLFLFQRGNLNQENHIR